ncbi:MAG: hypothetical protein R2848_05855 [Thermomicrobiales bacterium]
MDGVHASQVDDQTVIAGAQSRSVVSTTAHTNRQITFTGELHRRHDIGHIDRLHDERRALVDHAVVDGASGIVVRIVGRDDVAAHAHAQERDRLAIQDPGLFHYDCHDFLLNGNPLRFAPVQFRGHHQSTERRHTQHRQGCLFRMVVTGGDQGLSLRRLTYDSRLRTWAPVLAEEPAPCEPSH